MITHYGATPLTFSRINGLSDWAKTIRLFYLASLCL